VFWVNWQGVNIGGDLWDGKLGWFRCERLLRNYMKEKKVLVVTVVRGAKVDIADVIGCNAGLSCVPGLEKLSGEKAWFVLPVVKGDLCGCLSNFCTSG